MLKLAGVTLLLFPDSGRASDPSWPMGYRFNRGRSTSSRGTGLPAADDEGKSKSEHKCITADQAGTGMAALLVPNPKAQCRVDSLRIADGRYKQTVSCPQKSGPAIRIERAGVYDASGFSGHLVMASDTPKGAMKITLDQKAIHVAGICKG